MRQILFLALLVLLHLHVLNIGFLSHIFLFPKPCSLNSYLHHLCLQFLYPTNFLVRECFSLLVFNFIVDDICEYWQVLTSYSYDVASLIEDRALMQSPPPPPLPPPTSINVTGRHPLMLGSALYRSGRALTRRPF